MLKQVYMAWLLNKSYGNKVSLTGQIPPLKCCQPFELLTYIERGIRSFHTGEVGSASQMAAKLLSVKL